MILQVDLTTRQLKNLKLIVKTNKGRKIRFSHEQLLSNKGTDLLKLNKKQIKQICSATFNNRKRRADLHFTKEDLILSSKLPSNKVSLFMEGGRQPRTDTAITDDDRVLNLYKSLKVSTAGGIRPLSNFDLEDYMEEKSIKGRVVSRDKVPLKMDDNSCLVINLDKAGAVGTHWVVLIRKGGYFYYDPFGNIYPSEVRELLKRTSPKDDIYYNTEINQHFESIKCGYYCQACMNQILNKGRSFQSFMDLLEDYTQDNEDLVMDLIK